MQTSVVGRRGAGSEIAYYDFQLAVYVFKLYSFISGAIESDRSTGKRQCTFFFFYSFLLYLLLVISINIQ